MTFLFILLNLTFTRINGENILFFFGGSTYSHRLCVWPLVEALADRGHNVTFFSSYELNPQHPNIIEFAPKILQDPEFAFNAEVNLVASRFDGGNEKLWDYFLYPVGLNQTERILNDPVTRTWVNNSAFDLVIVDNFFNDVAIGLAYKFKAPYILFGTTAQYMWEYDEFGLQAETSWIPDLQYHYPENMGFFEKVKNTLLPLKWHFMRDWWFLPKVERELREALDMPDMPSLRELQKKVGAVLMNMHYSEEYARSLPPLVVPVGGIHIQNNSKPLPKDLASFIQKGGSEDGFMLVTFGSAIKFSYFPENWRQGFFKALKNSKTRFILKWDGSPLPENFPENVFPSNWLPQQDILAHPKIKGFITHGGLLGIHEAVYYGVPLIVLPLFAEQDYNAERVQNGGYGIRLEMTELTQGVLESSIQKLLENDSYKIKMSQVSKVFHDRPVKPLDSAVWWTEFVLRHKETPFLKPKSIHQSWYERRLLDVWGFVFVVINGISILFSIVLWKIISFLTRKEQKSPKLKTK